MRGRKDAPLMLLEYGDYQCSSCGESYVIVNKVLRELGQNVAFIFRNFPLSEIHPDAFEAALAAEAAGLQNKFWEMYDLLFLNQARLSGRYLFSFAKDIGLDMRRFEQDIESQAPLSKIEADIEGGLQRGVNETPTFYLNDEKYEGNWEGEELIYRLKAMLQRTTF
jgi:protein-disulfide isomerase